MSNAKIIFRKMLEAYALDTADVDLTRPVGVLDYALERDLPLTWPEAEILAAAFTEWVEAKEHAYKADCRVDQLERENADLWRVRDMAVFLSIALRSPFAPTLTDTTKRALQDLEAAIQPTLGGVCS